MKLSIFVMAAVAFVASAAAAETADSLAVRQTAQNMISRCQTAGCFGTVSFKLPDDIGSILRTTCNADIDCWKGGLKYLSAYQVPFDDLDAISRYKIGMTLSACTGIPDVPSFWKSSFTGGRARLTCWDQAISVLRSIEPKKVFSQNSWRRTSYVDLISTACYDTAPRESSGGSILPQLKGQNLTVSCYEQGLITLMRAPLPKTAAGDQMLRMSILKSACGHLDWDGSDCWDRGMKTFELPYLGTEMITAGCATIGQICYEGAFDYLHNPRPEGDSANIKYTAGLVLHMCGIRAANGYYFRGGPCVEAALEQMTVKDGAKGVSVREQNIQPAIRPILEILHQCQGTDSGCYYQTLQQVYDFL